jgi:hypothetical protein
MLSEAESVDRGFLSLLDATSSLPEAYDVATFARLVRETRFTVREWCRRGRIAAVRSNQGRAYSRWIISHNELLRYRREGLLPEGGLHQCDSGG